MIEGTKRNHFETGAENYSSYPVKSKIRNLQSPCITEQSTQNRIGIIQK